MKWETNQSLARRIQGQIGDRDIARHLRTLPAFAVPANSNHVFRHLLEKLDGVSIGEVARPPAAE
jgi:hypothetical protein